MNGDNDVDGGDDDDVEMPSADDGSPSRHSTRIHTNASSRVGDPEKKRYRQSKHKNVFKNFGTALKRFIVFNPAFTA
jgi:hypothetical protein